MSHLVIISLGSNCSQRENIASAATELASFLEEFRLTSTMWTDDIHGRNFRYLNQLAAGYTDLTVEELVCRLKTIEARQGRRPGKVTIDLDLMSYDGCRYHEQDWTMPYIQQLIDELA